MKVIFLPVCLIAFAAICFGQSRNIVKPDLSGTWELDSGSSSVPKFRSNWPEQIKITHYDPKLIIRNRVIINGAPAERDLTYYTDGSGEKNPADWLTTDPRSNHFKPFDAASKTTWNKDKIVIRSISRTYAGAAIVDLEIIDGFRLSSDGKTLTRTTRFVPRRVLTGDGALEGGRTTDSQAVYKLISK